jgi:hypothetical protein
MRAEPNEHYLPSQTDAVMTRRSFVKSAAAAAVLGAASPRALMAETKSLSVNKFYVSKIEEIGPFLPRKPYLRISS